MANKQRPQSEDECIIQALNIHGIFFERWYKQAVEDASGWECASTYEPVEFHSGTGKESNLDLKAILCFDESADGYLRLLTLLVECKKKQS